VRAERESLDDDEPSDPLSEEEEEPEAHEPVRKRARNPLARMTDIFLNILQDAEKLPGAADFLNDVSPLVEGYYALIKHPMSFATLRRNIKAKEYHSMQEFLKDVRLIFTNCVKFNEDKDWGPAIIQDANSLVQFIEAKINENRAELDQLENEL